MGERVRVRLRGPFCMICQVRGVQHERTMCEPCFKRMTHFHELDRQKRERERLKDLAAIPGDHERDQIDPEVDRIYSGSDLIETLIKKHPEESRTKEASDILNELAATGELQDKKKRRKVECPAEPSGSNSKSKPRVRLL